MSIYGTTFSAGYLDDPDSVGVVLIRDGGSNHWPTLEANRRGAIDGAHIPSWCVPGVVEADGYDDRVGTWYRLSGCSWRSIDGGPARLWSDQEYLLDEAAATALRDDLTAWLDTEKAHPKGQLDG